VQYRFADFVFDPETGLWRSGEQVPIEPLAHELLHHLLRSCDRIVTRDELERHLWHGRLVTDAAISTQIRTVRRALGDDRARQQFIRTHPRRGFRFATPVEVVHETPAERAGGAAPGETGAAPPEGALAALLGRAAAPLRQRRPAAAFLAVAGALLVAAALALWSGRDAPAPVVQTAPRLSVAVLPFEDLSADSSRDYLADAFTEDLVTDLSRIRDVFVISRSTTFTYRGKDVDAATVARELGVRYVLEGSLRVDGGRVRINAQLIDGTSNSHVWSSRYNPRLTELFDVQENVTGRIASVLRAELRVAENRRQGPRVTSDAWDHALQGNVILFNHETIADYQQAYDHLMQAVELDPSISSAWGGLAFIHFVASLTPIPEISRPDSAALSLDAALEAVKADPMNAEPYWLVGAGYARIGEPERGMPACRTAMSLNPNMDCGHVCAGLVHLASGEPRQAVPFFQHALRLNPRFRPFTKEKYLGLAYIQSGRDERAIEALNRALSTAPTDRFANLALSAALALDGQVDEAREVLRSYEQRARRPISAVSSLRPTVGWLGPNVERMLDGLRRAGVPER